MPVSSTSTAAFILASSPMMSSIYCIFRLLLAPDTIARHHNDGSSTKTSTFRCENFLRRHDVAVVGAPGRLADPQQVVEWAHFDRAPLRRRALGCPVQRRLHIGRFDHEETAELLAGLRIGTV